MIFNDYDWTDSNIEHVARHQVTPQEVEEACYNQPLVLKGGKNRNIVYVRSDGGRYLFIVGLFKAIGLFRIITARDMTPSEKRLFNKKKK